MNQQTQSPNPENQAPPNGIDNSDPNMDVDMDIDIDTPEHIHYDASIEAHKFYVILYNSLMTVKNILAMPTDDNIESMVKCSFALFGITFLGQLTGLYTFITWQGALINAIILTVLMCYEKGEENALIRTYQKAEKQVKKAHKVVKQQTRNLKSNSNSSVSKKAKTHKKKKGK